MKTSLLLAALAATLSFASCAASDGIPVAPGGSSDDHIVTFYVSQQCLAEPFALTLSIDGKVIDTYRPFPYDGVKVHVRDGNHTYSAGIPGSKYPRSGTFLVDGKELMFGIGCPHSI